MNLPTLLKEVSLNRLVGTGQEMEAFTAAHLEQGVDVFQGTAVAADGGSAKIRRGLVSQGISGGLTAAIVVQKHQAGAVDAHTASFNE